LRLVEFCEDARGGLGVKAGEYFVGFQHTRETGRV
jgi:hypothetical protein